MNILMVTNVYTPHVGGVAHSVVAFSEAYRQLGHKVTIVAPEADEVSNFETDVIRVPAIQHFNGSDFSVVLPVPAALSAFLNEFNPDVVHSHHPFLLGMTALRIAHSRQVPLVFTNHTMYENYTHYVPGDSEAMKRFVVELATRYANLADHVLAPSESVSKIICDRGVRSPVTVLPTGVDVDALQGENNSEYRRHLNIPDNAFVVGHVGRLAPEKNLEFLARAVSRYMQTNEACHFIVGGDGPSREQMHSVFRCDGTDTRVHFLGYLRQPELAWAYHCMDTFAFSSFSETQGMVLNEAMACTTPVVAIDAPGVREIVKDRANGRLLNNPTVTQFADALSWIASLDVELGKQLRRNSLDTAYATSIKSTSTKALDIYQHLNDVVGTRRQSDFERLTRLLRLIDAELDIIREVASAATAALAFKAA